MSKVSGKKVKIRMIVSMVFFFLAIGGLVGRLVNFQIVNYTEYQAKAVENQTRDTIINPVRGTIYDRNMKASPKAPRPKRSTYPRRT
jgi:stage V sporulation protein D (sporulation-specific penicillin-binding protein)